MSPTSTLKPATAPPSSKHTLLRYRLLTQHQRRGAPTGNSIKVAGKYDAYVAAPPADKKHEGVGLLYIPDVIGIWQNSQLMADQLAANGYLTLIIDVFNGDPIPLNRPGTFDFMAWMTKGSTGDNPHTKEAVDPIVVEAIKTLKEQYGVKKLGALGYCFGAKVNPVCLPNQHPN